jgi:hypothetical protein
MKDAPVQRDIVVLTIELSYRYPCVFATEN